MRSQISGLSIHKLEVFCTVAELENVSRAAERLGIAQPAVSSHLKILAQKIGAPLFEQQGRKMRLTDTGEQVLRWASEMVSRTRELERELDLGPGSAVVGASMTIGSYVLPALLAKYRLRNKAGSIDLRIATPQAVLDSIHRGYCDFAFTLLSEGQSLPGLDVRQIYQEDLVLVRASGATHLPNHTPPSDLEHLAFISAPQNSVRRDIEDQLLAKFGVKRKNIILAVDHAEAIKQAVRSGVGFAFLFRSSVESELRAKELEEVQVANMRTSIPIYLVQRGGKRMSDFQAKLLDELIAELSDMN